MWECQKLPSEWQYHPQAAHSIGTYNLLNADTTYDLGENETNRKVQLGNMLVDDNACSLSMLVLLINWPTAKQDQECMC